MTFAQLVTAIGQTVFPERRAGNLLANHRLYIIDGLIDLQRKVPCLRTGHVTRVRQDDTFFNCGANAFAAPHGYMVKLWTEVDGDHCAKVDYKPTDRDDFECKLADLDACGCVTPPYYLDEYTDLYWYYSDAETDKQCRATQGWWTLFNGFIQVLPSIQSNEEIVLEWDGIQEEFDDAETVAFDRETVHCVELYLEAEAMRREDHDMEAWQAATAIYMGHVAGLIHTCDKENRMPPRVGCLSNCAC